MPNPPALPYNSEFTGNTVPSSVQPCHSYDVTVTVKNTGTLNWTSANMVNLVPSSVDGITFTPNPVPIPDGVVIQPGQEWTFPLTINIPCSMMSDYSKLRFKLAYTMQTKSGPVIVPFGDTLSVSVDVGASATKGLKIGEKTVGASSASTPGIKYTVLTQESGIIIPRATPIPLYKVPANGAISNRLPIISTPPGIGVLR